MSYVAQTREIQRLREAIRLTREYVGEPMLPAVPGWSWFDAIASTGGFDGFGGCGCVLDPQEHGRTPTGGLHYCGRSAGHDGPHTPLSDSQLSVASDMPTPGTVGPDSTLDG